MKRFILLILILSSCLGGSAFGYEIVVVKSSKSHVNERVQQLFIEEFAKRVAHRGTKTIQPHQVVEVLVAKDGEKEIKRTTESIQPDLILALGIKALKASLSVPDIPLVHLLVIDGYKYTGARTGVAGVTLFVPPKVQLDEMSRLLPAVKRVGLVYDPKRSGKMIGELAAVRPDLEFVALAATDTASVPGLIRSLRGRVDLLWMLPDLTVINRKTVKSYVLFSVKNKVPILTFSEKLLKGGATLAVTFDLDGMAEQAAELAVEMLSDGEEPAVSVAPRPKTIINQRVVKILELSIEGREDNDD